MASTSANTAAYQAQDQLTHASEGHAPRPFTSATPSLTASSPSAKPTNAFEDLAPSSSTSVRSTMTVKKVPYDVFINHRGPDVKKGLATHLYKTLNGMGLRVFLDSEELELGDSFPHEIEEAIHSASLHLAIFSKDYAQSPWCLAELSLMLKTGTQIVPVFYHVQPDDVRYAKGVYQDAFSRHKKKGRYTPEKLEEWKKALCSVSYNVGHIIDTEDDEAKLLKNIANYAVKIIKNVPLVVAKHPVGLDEAVQDFEMTTLQYVEGHSTVQVVGIWGMGGVGKTTLAKKLYNNKYKTMERCSFLFAVRDAAHTNVLHIKQKKLLQDLGVNDVKVDNIEEGKGMLARHLRSVRVLIVLDDVDNVDQLDALVPDKDNLRPGSLIVVTTQHFDVLTGWGISSSSVYKMKRLDPSHCQQLFCWHAFLQPFPKDGFTELVKKFMHACDGLPLSLKVFGGQLYGKSEQDYWESQLEKVIRILPDDILNRLKVSYDALDDEEKEAFLDAACFFIGEQKSLAIEVWNGSEGSGLCSWETLVNRCLVEVDEMDCIRMHDHLRDLGRKISKQQSPVRLLFPNHTFNVENQVEKRINIRGIMATSIRLEWHPRSTETIRTGRRRIVEPERSSHQDGKALFNTREGIWTLSPSLGGLKFIVVRGHDLNQVIGEASTELVWLRWFHAGRRNLPYQLSLKNLMVLEIYETSRGDCHLKELWKDASDAPIHLTELVISGCTKFQRFPESIGSLKHLKKIVVEQLFYSPGWDYKLKSLPRDFCLLQSLKHLKLCCQLSSLPDNFGDLRNLQYLHLSGCWHLRRLPVSFKGLTLLQHLHLQGFIELTIEPDIMKDMRKLEYFNLCDCKKLEELPRHITNQPSLRELHLTTESLREVPVNIGQLSKLRKLIIHSKSLTSLPTSLGDLSSLTSLILFKCPKLESLPDSMGHLSMLEDLMISFSGVKSLPNSVRELINLQKLSIEACPISELDPVSGPFASSLCNLKQIELWSTEVSKISISEDCCPSLETLELKHNYHLIEIQVLPNTLQSIVLEGCPELDVLPSFAQSAFLRVFELKGCHGVKKIQGLEHCRELEMLTAHTRWEKVGIESLEHMERLRKVELQAISRKGVEGCIQSMQRWPKEEIIVCTRAAPNVAAIVDSFASPSLFVVDSFANRKINSNPYLKWPSNARCVLLCFVVNCKSPKALLELTCSTSKGGTFTHHSIGYKPWELEEGKWVLTALFTQHSIFHKYISRHIESRVHIYKWDAEVEGEVERGLLVTGEEDGVWEAFTRLCVFLSN